MVLVRSSMVVQQQDSAGRFLCTLCEPRPIGIRAHEKKRRYNDQWVHETCYKRITRAGARTPTPVAPRVPSPSTSAAGASTAAPTQSMLTRMRVVATDEEIMSKQTMVSHRWVVTMGASTLIQFLSLIAGSVTAIHLYSMIIGASCMEGVNISNSLQNFQVQGIY